MASNHDSSLKSPHPNPHPADSDYITHRAESLYNTRSQICTL